MRLLNGVIPIAALSTAAACLAADVRPACAQQQPLAQVLPDLILREIVIQSPVAGISHVAHFSPLEGHDLNNPVVGIVQGFNTQIATQFSTFPLGSSSGGMTYVFDDTVGTFRRSSMSFGPMFAERALTIGRRKLNVGFNYQHTPYATFEGQDLADGAIKFYLRHNDCCTGSPTAPLVLEPNGTRLSPPFEGDIIEASLSLKATTDTSAVFANYGLTDRWDIGLALPFVRVALDASVTARILRLVTDPRTVPGNPLTPEQTRAALNTHTFEIDNPDATLTVGHSGRAAGLGDIVIRTKYRVIGSAGGGVAASMDLRLPTGDENQLLGAGGTEAKFLLIVSSARGRFGQHANVGYTTTSGHVAGTVPGLTAATLPDEINYTGGVDFVPNPRLTVMADVIGRTLRDAGRLQMAPQTFEYNQFTPASFQPGAPVGCAGFPATVCQTASFDALTPRPGNLTLLLGTGGLKYNVGGNLLVTGSVLFPLTNAGLRSRLTAVVGVDYAF